MYDFHQSKSEQEIRYVRRTGSSTGEPGPGTGNVGGLGVELTGDDNNVVDRLALRGVAGDRVPVDEVSETTGIDSATVGEA
jgi:hypothetical protein